MALRVVTPAVGGKAGTGHALASAVLGAPQWSWRTRCGWRYALAQVGGWALVEQDRPEAQGAKLCRKCFKCSEDAAGHPPLQ